MQETLRLFVAVPLPLDVQQYLIEARQVYEMPGIRLVPTQNLHLTLFFIGNVAATEQTTILQHLRQLGTEHGPFTLQLERIEPGPTRQAPRLVWARFKQHAQFEQLSNALVKTLSTVPVKKQKSIPHVTIARIQKDHKSTLSLPSLVPDHELCFPVNSLALWQSTLASSHPVYTVLEEFKLGIR